MPWQHLANTAWAFATMKYFHKQLLAGMARKAEQRMGELNAKDLVNTE